MSPVGPTRKSRNVRFRAAVRGVADANAPVQLFFGTCALTFPSWNVAARAGALNWVAFSREPIHIVCVAAGIFVQRFGEE